MTITEEIVALVRHFDEHRDTYRAGFYSEARLRRYFIEPMLKILGWDIDNEKSLTEQEREIILSDFPTYTGTLKAPDYCFRINGIPKFFLEAKKPFADIKHGIRPAYQLRRFAWSAALPFSLFTDFEELSVYDCRIRPQKDDRASRARIMYMQYEQYPEQWENIVSICSRDAVEKNSFENRYKPKNHRHGPMEAGESLLLDFDRWRNKLEHIIRMKNKELSKGDISIAARRTAKRIIFLKICEDRGIESFGQLRNLTKEGDISNRLNNLCEQATKRHNSCLFHFSIESDLSEDGDRSLTDIIIDDRFLRRMIESIYYPNSPYEFSIFPDDAIGRVLAYTTIT